MENIEVPRPCPWCGKGIPSDALVCRYCEKPIPSGVGGPVGPLPRAAAPPQFVAPPFPAPGMFPQAIDRTLTGLLLMIVGFSLDWIPFANYLGGLLGLIGIVFLFLGRNAFGERHRALVIAGAGLFVLALFITIADTVNLIFSAVSYASQPGVNATAVGTFLQGDFQTFYIVLTICGIMTGIANVLLVYALADRMTRFMLWAAFLALVATSLLVAAFVLPQIESVLAQPASGGAASTAAVSQLETAALLWETAGIFGYVLFAWGYYRVRERVKRPELWHSMEQ